MVFMAFSVVLCLQESVKKDSRGANEDTTLTVFAGTILTLTVELVFCVCILFTKILLFPNGNPKKLNNNLTTISPPTYYLHSNNPVT